MHRIFISNRNHPLQNNKSELIGTISYYFNLIDHRIQDRMDKRNMNAHLDRRIQDRMKRALMGVTFSTALVVPFYWSLKPWFRVDFKSAETVLIIGVLICKLGRCRRSLLNILIAYIDPRLYSDHAGISQLFDQLFSFETSISLKDHTYIN